ncbi:MAG: hypothetical protein ACPGVO_18440 [Spirulinaceae cyanobacterium]
MMILNGLGEFSRANCVAICSVLVPLNLGWTIATLIGCYLQRPLRQLQTSTAIAAVFALILCLHVSSWFVIGVVTPVTFVLLTLALTCCLLNGLALTPGVRSLAPKVRAVVADLRLRDLPSQ